MMLTIPDVLDADDVARVRAIIDAAEWIDGNATSGAQSALAKRNRQLPEDGAAAREAGAIVLDALGRSPLFVAAALPLKVFPPLFNRYAGGEAFGAHVDNAIRIQRGSDFRIRSDLSATLFLADPDSYDGGELVIEDAFGEQRVKLPARAHGALSGVERAPRRAGDARACGWRASSGSSRWSARRRCARSCSTSTARCRRSAARWGRTIAAAVELTGVYHNLLRRWADVHERRRQ